MNGSIRKAPLGLVVAAALALAAPASHAQAPEDEPLRLIQEQEPVDEPAPEAAEPAETKAPAPEADTELETGAEPAERPSAGAGPAEAPPEDGILVRTLEEIAPEAIGAPLPGLAPLPPDLWSGSSRQRIERLLELLPVRTSSPAMRRLALRLLAAPALPPEGDGTAAEFATLRAAALAAMGERAAALTLLDRNGPDRDEERIARLESDRWLAALDYESVCEPVADRVSRSAAFYWRQVLILCQARAGLVEAATLGLDLLREAGAAPDSAFDQAIYAMAGFAEPVIELPDGPGPLDIAPLDIAALRLARIPIPAEAVERVAPDLLPAIANSPETPPETRLLAAEHADMAGAAPADALLEAYRAHPFSPDERENARHLAPSLAPPLGRALTVQAAEAEALATARAEILANALAFAEDIGTHTAMARAVAPLVRDIPPTHAFGWFAPSAARALIAAGDHAAAAMWHETRAASSPDTVNEPFRPLAALGGDAGSLSAETFGLWLRSQTDTDSGAHDGARRLAVLLDALGHQLEPAIWDELLGAPPEPPGAAAPAVLTPVLRDAVTNGRLGETILAALATLGEKGPAGAGLSTVAAAVRALSAVGSHEEARETALEAALAAGL